MAKRSDFAQKLLDDLRLRKERMAISQTSKRSNHMHSDAYGNNSRQTYGGSREVTPRESMSARTGNKHKWSGTGSSRPLAIEGGASQAIVQIGRTRSSEHIADLSMALAFALENGGKLRKMESSGNPMVGFLQHIGTRSMDLGKMERRWSMDKSQPLSNRFPSLSHLHIKEISRGAQKLNQILKACSNGLNFDRYSIDIGMELLKGAMDLEESLRMLVNLQEASDYMVSPQRKQRIRLLEEEEDDDDTTITVNEQKQLDRPRFSFDGPSRNSHDDIHEVAKNGFPKQRLLALSYPTEAPRLTREKQVSITSSNSVSRRRSASCGPDSTTLAAFSDPRHQSSSSHSKPEKGRIPSVIAKLMGLEELPPDRDSKVGAQNKSSFKQRREGKDIKQNAYGSSKNAELNIMDSENYAPKTVRLKELQTNKVSAATGDTSIVLQADNIMVTHNANLEMVTRGGKPQRKNPENTEDLNLVSDSKQQTSKANKQQINMTQLNQITGIRKDQQEKERRQDNANPKEPKSTEKGEPKELLSKDDLQRMALKTHKHSESAYVKPEKEGDKGSTLQKEKKHVNRFLMPSNQPKPSHDSGFQQPYLLRNPKDEKLQAVERERQNAKNKLQVKKQKGSEIILKNSLKTIHDAGKLQKKLPHIIHATVGKRSSIESFDAMPFKGSPKSIPHEDLITNGTSTNHKLNMKILPSRTSKEQNASPRDPETDVGKATAPIPPGMSLKPVRVLPTQKKVDKAQYMHKSETPQKMDGVETPRNLSPRNIAKPLKQQFSVLQELKQIRHEKTSRSKEAEKVTSSRSKEEEVCIIRSNKTEASIQPFNLAQHLQQEADRTPILGNPTGDECRMPKERDIIAPNATSQDLTSKFSHSQQAPQLVVDKDGEPKSYDFVMFRLKGPYEGAMVISNSSQQEQKKISKSGTQGSLTENENHLKQILIKSQLFLNAAEALFKLHIPVGILHASAHKCQDEDSKLDLDSGYEVMKRKGRRQELTYHRCMAISIGSMKIKSLDDLVKALHEDLEKLKFRGKNGSDEYDAADYLHKILERDIQNRDPDVNCMWDFGWSETMFAYLEKDDVIREVERHVFNGLIDEITRDFILCK
ncbi:hypothetical protein HHK36_002477 [Tetracentron sinense]|uniref:DUF3741 domain-containing protein n=1 Tax=Tetracentron sinense TaxID=13715 RepID=A0A834ZRH0_TETSI|nr:hypothetical protein HHK36_002477 [Tetracentron sinense]